MTTEEPSPVSGPPTITSHGTGQDDATPRQARRPRTDSAVTTLERPAQVISAALRAASALTGMELVYLSELSPETFTWREIEGAWPGVEEGETLPRADTFCSVMLDGGPSTTSDAATDPAFSSVPAREALGITSYVGVPVVTGSGVVGTLCGIDHGTVTVDASTIAVLRALADVVAEQVDGQPTIRVVRSRDGWRVEGGATPPGGSIEADDLPVALTLADLFAGRVEPPARPPRGVEPANEVERLRLQVQQLEHALAARVVIEQALGTLAERQSVTPRVAFERLRSVARARGMRVHSLARSVVASSHEAVAGLPAELR